MSGNKTISYLYDAAGVKHAKIVNDNGDITRTDYSGAFHYEDNDLKFVNHEEGRLVPTESGFDYQYHLKDHLGNVRVTIKAGDLTSTYLATMETDNSIDVLEESVFEQVGESRVQDNLFDHTGTAYPELCGLCNEAARLNAGDPSSQVIGPGKSLAVNKGDTISIEVFAKYITDAVNANSITGIATFVAGAFGLTPATETLTAYNNLNSTIESGAGGIFNFSGDGTLPRAYLSFLYFDENHVFKYGGFDRISTDAKNSFQELNLQFIPDEPGYVYIYVANETDANLNVFFDDLKITHAENPIVQVDDYYPFGGTFGSYTSGDENLYKYNGKEEQKETGWYDYGARMYDPMLGRFFTQDRYAEKYLDFTPYQYAANNPILFIDVNGDSIRVAEEHREQFNSALSAVFGDKASGFSYTKSGNLVYNGDKKGLTKDQKGALKGLNKVIGEETITNVVFGESTEITLNDGSTGTVNAADGGGAVTVLVGENNVSENTILIDPNNSNVNSQLTDVFTVTDAYYAQPINPANGPRFNKQNIKNNTTSTIFHEIGHVLERGNTQDKVIDFENNARRQTGLPNRPYDETHNRTVKKGVYGN